jgi:probable HAF family extracellular repeat protein
MDASTHIQRKSWSRRRSLTLVALVGAALLAACSLALVATEPRQAEAADAPRYTITDLGAIPDLTDSYPTALNNSGQVVGYLLNRPGPDPIAFLYDDGVMTELGLMPGGYASEANGINDKGQIVGSAYLGAGKRAFLYGENGTMTNLGTLPNPGTYGSSGAHDINDFGQVVGYSDTLEGSTDLQPDEHAFLYEGGSMKDLGTLPSYDGSRASAINNPGQIVGYAEIPSTGAQTAILYEDGVTTDLGENMGAYMSRAQDINDSHQIVGGARLSSDQLFPHAFLYDADGSVTDLGTLPRHGSLGWSGAYALNSSGEVVGVSAMDHRMVDARAFIYSEGVMNDLNDLIPADSGWLLAGALDINDSGLIVGLGLNPHGQQRAFLLTPTYTWSGVLQPINGGATADRTDDTSIFKANSTVPVKLKLTGESAGITDAKVTLKVTKLSDTIRGDVLENPVEAVPTTGYEFRPPEIAGDAYIYNWSTKGLEPGTYKLTIDLGDGTATNADAINHALVSLK